MKVLFWIMTFPAILVCIALVVLQMQSPAIVIAAEVLTVASVQLLIFVPLALLAILDECRRTADNTKPASL